MVDVLKLIALGCQVSNGVKTKYLDIFMRHFC